MQRRSFMVMSACLLSGAAPPLPVRVSRIGLDVRGMTVSCPTWGGEWGTDAMATTLDVLKDLGVQWVSIHPYATIRGDGTVHARAWQPDAAHLVRPIREAHARGMKLMIKPHLAYWGSPFSWRGDIRFDSSEQWERFFSTYASWVENLATITANADAFVVATELEKTVRHEARWREVIARVRKVYEGPLVFAANWDGVDRVRFWDALDLIGVQAYFPLVKAGETPDEPAVREGWSKVMASMRDVSARTSRPVLFTELGYDSIPTAAYEPWKGGNRMSGADEDLQRLLLRVALEAVAAEPAVVGAFLWKWFPGEVSRGNFRMSTPTMRAQIRASWRPPEGYPAGGKTSGG